jgi:hypothetical protein
MRVIDLARRQFLRFLMSLPMAFTLGAEGSGWAAQAAPLTPQESLKKLVRVLGPWGGTNKEKAEDFAKRFVGAEHAVGPYLPRSSRVVQSLAGRFPPDAMAIKEINLRNVPPKERELLIELVKQIYSLTDVRFLVSNEPPRGQCLGDQTRHTRPPTSPGTIK